MAVNNVSSWRGLLGLEATSIIMTLEQHGAVVYVIGGTPRDLWWGKSAGDIDIEVYNMPGARLQELLSKMGSVKLVGAEFGVYDFTSRSGLQIDAALPRKEKQPGVSSKDIEATCDPNMPMEEAVKRRDLTVNGLMWRPTTNELFDLVEAIYDLDYKKLRPIGPAYDEDPVRPLRAFRLGSEHGMTPALELRTYTLKMLPRFVTIPKDRIAKEWDKWAKSSFPDLGLDILSYMGWLEAFPTLNALWGCQQDPIWHPEGDAWRHTVDVVQAMSRISDDPKLRYAALLHDAGKPATTVISEAEKTKGRWVSPGHDIAGESPARAFFQQLYGNGTNPLIEQVVALVKTHMRHINADVTDKLVRNLANDSGNIEDLYKLVMADHSGRPFTGKLTVPDEMEQILQRSRELAIASSKPKRILEGRHLQPYMPDGRAMGDIVKQGFQAQLDGEFTDLDGALNWLKITHGFGES